ncbi:MAG: PQQ-dependent sugar dehydrogenase [Acidimicrobiales bacterium]
MDRRRGFELSGWSSSRSRMSTPRLALLVGSTIAALAVIATRGDGASDDGGPPTTVASAGAGDATTTSTVPAGTPGPDQAQLDGVNVVLTPIATATEPVALASRPGQQGALFIAERGGRVRLWAGGALGPQPVIDVSDDLSVGDQTGVVGLAFSNDGELLYLSFTNAAGLLQVVEYPMDGTFADRSRGRQLFFIEPPYDFNVGGSLVMDPDGYLWIGLGDGGPARDPEDRGQRLDTLFGKLLRLDPKASNDLPYTVPEDNPYVGSDELRGEIWSYGLRNPRRFSFDRATGDLWIGDEGQYVVEEVDFVAGDTPGRGANFGWARFEGPIERGDPPPDAVPPFEFYNHDDGRCAVVGGYVYRGERIPGLQGAYLYSDQCDGRVRALSPRDGQVSAERILPVEADGMIGFGEDANGELYTLSLSTGVVSRLDPG